jgi:RimJ/RimL family protein N-acetyltransferase
MLARLPQLHVRPIDRADRALLADAFERMSERSRYQRFLHPKPRLTEEELDFFTDIDHRAHEAVAAVDPRDGSLVGVARYATLGGDATTADLAFFVVDDWHGRGIATMLVRALLDRAEANGITSFIALTLSENAAARALLKRTGFRKVDSSHGVVEMRLELGAPLRLAA